MSYDEILHYLGEFGRYQRCIFFLLCLTGVLSAIHAFSGVFLLAQPRFRCVLPEEFNLTNAKFSLPARIWEESYLRDAVSGRFRSCEYLTPSNSSSKCTRYIYDESVFANSAVTEWNLVCDRNWLVATNQALLMLGLLLGSIIFGQLADKYGRQPVLIAALMLQLVSGVLASFAPEYISYSVARLFVGSTVTGVFLTSYVLAMEMVGPRYRLFASVALMVSYSLGVLTLTAFAYFIRDWRRLQFSVALLSIIFVPYQRIIPESTRWLLLNNQHERAAENIQRLAKKNHVEMPGDLLETLLAELQAPKPRIARAAEAKMQRQPTVVDLLRLPNMRRKSVQIFFDWFVITATYYGLSWHTQLLGDNIMLNFTISALVEIPAHSSLLLVLNRLGRRIVLCGNLLLSGTGLLLTLTVPHGPNWLIVSFAMLGKFGITAAFGTIYIFSAEQFPTAVRNVGLGVASMMARFGGILTPYLFLLAQIWPPMPLVVCGALTFLAGSLTLLLPETLNRPTLETLEDGEALTRKRCKGTQGGREMKDIRVY